MDNARAKIVDLILHERRYSLIRWGDAFDNRHHPDDWCAFAIKELYDHRSSDVPPEDVYLWPDRKPDVPFMLALTGTAAVLLSNMDAQKRYRDPSVRSMKDAIAANHAILDMVGGTATSYYKTVNGWLNFLNDKIRVAYRKKDVSQLTLPLAHIMMTMEVTARNYPGLLDQAIWATQKRVISAKHHFQATRGNTPAKPAAQKKRAKASVQISTYVPTDDDFAQLGDRLTAFTLGIGGPDYKPVSVGFKAVAGEVTAGELIATTLWGRMEINLLEVSEEDRGRMIGTQLLEAAEEFAKRNGVGGIHLWTPTWQGKGFYETRGYSEATHLPLYLPGSFGKKKDHILYHKELIPS